MTAETPTNERLWRAFGCDMDDLVANRRGLLTDHQKQLLDQHIRIAGCGNRLAIFILLGSVLFFLVGAPFLIQDGPIPPQASPYLIATGVVLLGIVGLFIALGMRRAQSLRQGQIRMVEGPVKCEIKQFKHGRWTAYYAWVGEIRFQLTTQQQYKVLDEGAVYRIHYIHYPPTELILSIEEIWGKT